MRLFNLAGLAHVAVVPTLDDLNFLTVQIDQHGYHTYNLGAFGPISLEHFLMSLAMP